jgi:hypothetical protein
VIPVFQTKFGMPYGDCFAACVASILEMKIADVWDALPIDTRLACLADPAWVRHGVPDE